MNEGKNMEVTGAQTNTTNTLAAQDNSAEATARAQNVKVIKRYQNRKLYDLSLIHI